MQNAPKRQLQVSRAWVQAVVVVFLFGFFVLGLLAYRTYTGEPPIPGRIVVPEAYGGANSDRARAETIADFKANRYDAATDTLTFSVAQASAFQTLNGYYRDFFGEPTTKY